MAQVPSGSEQGQTFAPDTKIKSENNQSMEKMRNFVKTAALTAVTILFSATLDARGQKVTAEDIRDRENVVWTEMEGVRVPLPPIEHPRLYIRKDGIADLAERVKTPEGKEIIRKLKKASVPRTPEEDAAEKDRGFRYYAKMRGLTSKVQLQALDYLLNGDKKEARQAITSMLDSLQHTNFGTKSDLSRASGAMLMVGGIVYDWCYDQMKPSEREAYIKEFVRIAGTMECHYPPKRTESVAGHLSEWMILRDMLSCGIAIYDEYPDMYNYVIKMIFEDYIPARNFTYAGHNYHQGTGYIVVRYLNDLNSLWILDKMGAGAIYDPSQQFVLYDCIYRRRPDNQVMPAGDYNPGPRNKIKSYAMPAMLASSYYKDEYLAYEFEREPKVEESMLILELLWRDFSLKGKAPDDLPLTRYSGTPFGWMIARTGWDENSVIAEMKVNEHFYGNHQHLDGGSFQLYYKGPLAIDSGSYQGAAGGYSSPHNKNYFKRTIAHNSLLVYDPDEKFPCWNYGGSDKTEFAANDGGQRMPGDRWQTCMSYEDLLSEDYTVGKALAHGFGPDANVPEWSYLKGDITKAYSDKVSDVRRSFVFLNLDKTGNGEVPAAFLVYDHVVSANPDFKKFWLLHSIEEPVAGEQAFTVRRTKNGDSGMLHCNVLLPQADDLEINVVGGRENGKEFWVFGKNYPNAATTRPDPCNERGEWRVEVCPKAPAAENAFFNVMQVADNKCKNLHEVKMLDAGKVVGAVVADRIVIFSKDSKALKGGFSFTVKGDKTYKVLVTDLLPGTWQVRKDGRVFIAGVDVRESEGVLYFEAGPGTYEFLR